MPMRLIQLILGKLGWDGDARPSVTMLPPGNARPPSAADSICRITDNYVIPPYGEYGQTYDGVEGQDILIEIAADGGILVHLFEGDEDDGTELFDANAPPFQSPYRISYQLPATGYYTVLVENPGDESIHVHLNVTCPANVAAIPKKGPSRASGIANSAAAGAEGLGNGQPQHGGGNRQQIGLVLPGDRPEQPSVFIAGEQADTQTEHSNPSGQKADDDVEPSA